MKKAPLNLFLILIIISLCSCNKLETIPVYENTQNIENVNNRLYTYSAWYKFGKVPAYNTKAGKTQQKDTRSYIKTNIKTNYIKFTESKTHAWLFKTIKWLGLIIVILTAAFGFFLIKPTNKKAQKRRNLIRIIVSQIPLIAFLYFINYSYLFIFLWHAIIVVALIVGSSSEFKKKHLFTIPIALFLLAWSGYKAGPKVHIDNALEYPVWVQINECSSTLLPAKSHTLVRISSNNPRIKVKKGEAIIEEVKLPLKSTYKVLILQSLFPWKKYIYNINGQNKYSLQNGLQ